MQYHLVSSQQLTQLETDCLIVAVYKDGDLSTSAHALDQAMQGSIREILNYGDFSGKKKQTCLLYDPQGVNAKRLLLVGCGKRQAFDLKTLRSVQQSAIETLEKSATVTITSCLGEDLMQEESSSRAAIIQSVSTTSDILYRFERYKSEEKQKPASSLELMEIAVNNPDDTGNQQALLAATGLAEGVKLARDLGNNPGNVCTPSFLAQIASTMALEHTAVDTEVLEEADMEALGMGAFLSVSKGSVQPGKMVVMHYRGADEETAPVALVGKGITFDSGGISLKPGGGMDEMKYDMGGAASVLGTMRACAEMALPINIVAIIAAAENMPDGIASKPGDIVTTMSGKTVEILNTDAEGRLVLCDALTYVGRYKPELVIDIATLTGACIVALGHHISGMLSNDDTLAAALNQAGKQILDPVWRLPLGEEYQAQIDSNFADMGNIGSDRSAGTITAACFLERFAKEYRWAHLDVAGTAWKSGKAKGGTGRPVPLLVQFLMNHAEKNA